jgi:hypothetical protein
MSRSDTSLEQRPVDWDMEDHARWWEDQRRDEEELQQMRMEVLRDQIKREVEEEFQRETLPEIKAITLQLCTKVYRMGFFLGFCAALVGAVLFIYFVL